MTQAQILELIQRKADTARKIADEYRAEAQAAIAIDEYKTKRALSERFATYSELLRILIGEIKENDRATNYRSSI